MKLTPNFSSAFLPPLFRLPRSPPATSRPRVSCKAFPDRTAVAAAIAVSVIIASNPTPTLSSEAPTAPSTDTSAEQQAKKDLRETSRRNTRVSGAASQLFARARRIAESGDLQGAIQAYDELITSAPTFAPGYSNRGNLFVSQGRLSDAIADYDQALSLAPLDGDTWVLYLNRGAARLARGDEPYDVLQDLNAAHERKGDDSLVLSNRAAVYEALGKWDAAIRDYQGALKGGNEVKPFWLRYGLVLFQKGKNAEAVAILRRVQNKFNVDDVRAALSVIYFETGDIASAETQWSVMDRPKRFESRALLKSKSWPPRAIDAMDSFRSLKE